MYSEMYSADDRKFENVPTPNVSAFLIDLSADFSKQLSLRYLRSAVLQHVHFVLLRVVKSLKARSPFALISLCPKQYLVRHLYVQYTLNEPKTAAVFPLARYGEAATCAARSKN